MQFHSQIVILNKIISHLSSEAVVRMRNLEKICLLKKFDDVEVCVGDHFLANLQTVGQQLT